MKLHQSKPTAFLPTSTRLLFYIRVIRLHSCHSWRTKPVQNRTRSRHPTTFWLKGDSEQPEKTRLNEGTALFYVLRKDVKMCHPEEKNTVPRAVLVKGKNVPGRICVWMLVSCFGVFGHGTGGAGGDSPVDEEGLAGNVGSGVGGEEDESAVEFLGPAGAL